MGRWAWIGVLAAAGAGALEPRAIAVPAVLTVLVAVGGRRPARRGATRTRRDLAVASCLLAVVVLVPDPPPVLRSFALVVATVAVGAATTGSTPASSRTARLADVAQAVTVAVLAAVAALATAASTEVSLPAEQLVAVVVLAVTVGTWQLARRSLRATADGGDPAHRWGARGLAALALASAVEVSVDAAPVLVAWRPALAAAAVAGCAACWLVAARLSTVPGARGPSRPAVVDSVGPGQLLPSVLAVAGGPAVLAAAALRAGAVTPEVVALTLVPALPATLHLLLLVRDRVDRSHRALRDPLTDLVTEPVFTDRLERAITAGRRDGRGVAVAFLDLDGFKAINDRAGHDAGDAVLCTVAERLLGVVREGDTVARRSGDEFLVLLPGVDRATDAQVVADKLVATVGSGMYLGSEQLQVGVSVGLALWPRDASGPEELVRRADGAMYEAKAASGGRVRWCSSSGTTRARLAGEVRDQLEAAVAADALTIAVQPALHLDGGSIERLHALLRWDHPTLGRLTPGIFLPLLVDPEVARQLDLAALGRAVRTARAIGTAGWLDVPVVASLTTATVTWPQLSGRVARVLTDTGLPPADLVIAVDEHTVRTAGAALLVTAAELDDLGVRLLVTRVGAGPVDVRAYAALPLAGLEVGAATVATHPRPGSRAVLRTVTALADALGCPASAAGVLGPDAATAVRDAGYTIARGSHLGAPRDLPALGAALEAVREAGTTRDGAHDPARVAAEVLSAGWPDSTPRADVAGALAAVLRPDATVSDEEVALVAGYLDGSVAPEPTGPTGPTGPTERSASGPGQAVTADHQVP
ncbi:diguanylate cyclase [Nitriliruptoraceae bacterium ZYF776]|nr:diguanylate cyclase [Profundirhabdus halotolerans]